MKTLLETTLAQNFINMTVSQDGLETHVVRDKLKGTESISAAGIVLFYDPQRFQNEPEKYVEEQLLAHQKYQKLVGRKMKALSRELDEINARERKLQNFLGGGPKGALELVVQLAKLAVSPLIFVTQGVTLKTFMERLIAMERANGFAYSIVEAVIDYGKEIVDVRLDFGNQTEGLKEWANIQRDLSNGYGRFNTKYKEKLKGIEEKYALFYPEGKAGD